MTLMKSKKKNKKNNELVKILLISALLLSLASVSVMSSNGDDTPTLGISIALLPEFAEINVGGTIVVSTRLVNHGLEKPEDIVLRYTLQAEQADGKQEDVLEVSETVAVQTSGTFVKSIYIPLYLNSGNYQLRVRAEFAGKETEATRSLTILNRERSEIELIYILLGLIGLISFTFIIVTYAFTRQLMKIQNR